MRRFARYHLRTTDVPAAISFYRAVLGTDELDVVELPALARSRGAPAHWLGQIGVDDVAATVSAFVAHGAEQLGPTSTPAPGTSVAVLRDPGGSVVGLTSATEAARHPVAWHSLQTHDLARATSAYRELFGWHFGDAVDLGAHGVHREFRFDAAGPAVGSIVDVTGRPEVHAHWLFHFAVTDLERACALVREGGGLALAPVSSGRGVMVAACEDAQRAAFALRAPAA